MLSEQLINERLQDVGSEKDLPDPVALSSVEKHFCLFGVYAVISAHRLALCVFAFYHDIAVHVCIR